ncbi:hypothetical protein [Enterococcus mundtii]|uniref:hypothetical protein n=1 Tax=Enterococcus mundtii TaxID=53346 RepID=UPI0035C711C6
MKVFTKLMVGAFVVTALGVVGGNQTVSAGIEENIPGSNVANYFNNKVVKIQSEMNRRNGIGLGSKQFRPSDYI